jgi:probable HAF family extracellular repeat protein
MKTIAVGFFFSVLLFAASTCFGQSYTITDLGTLPGGSSSSGQGINASGQVTGFSATTSSNHAFLYSAGTGMTDLGTLPGGSSSFGAGINAAGQVTGYANTTSSKYHAFLYSAGIGMVALGTLPGDSGSAGSGINASGQVTGSSNINASGQAPRAFLYSAATGMIDLNTVLPSGSGWTLYAATAINDAGQITGYGLHNPTCLSALAAHRHQHAQDSSCVI